MKKNLTAVLVALLFVIGSIMPIYVGSIDESPCPEYPMQYCIELPTIVAARGPVDGTIPPPVGKP
ncbi:MAG: hypothetical protein FWC73_11405 [Defluviitaleaceae bacterium]|nr:hypothetical protein [Defluviitaleaceae bacterium]